MQKMSSDSQKSEDIFQKTEDVNHQYIILKSKGQYTL